MCSSFYFSGRIRHPAWSCEKFPGFYEGELLGIHTEFEVTYDGHSVNFAPTSGVYPAENLVVDSQWRDHPFTPMSEYNARCINETTLLVVQEYLSIGSKGTIDRIYQVDADGAIRATYRHTNTWFNRTDTAFFNRKN